MDKPRGRAALFQLLRKPGGGGDAPAQVGEATAPAEPPRSRGRAQLLEKLKQTAPAPKPAAIPPESIETTSVTTQLSKLKVEAESPVFKKAPKGTSGSQINITANYVRLVREKDTGFHKYEVKFSPDVDSKSARMKLIKAIIPKIGHVHMFNGSSDLYLPLQLPESRVVLESPHPFDAETIITLTIIYKKLEPFGSAQSIHFINVIFKRIMNKLRMKPIGRNYFCMEMTKFIPQYALEIIPGYAVAVDEMEGGLLVCFDTCHKLLRKKSVLELLIEIRQSFPNNFKEKAIDELMGQTVLTSYNNASYIIDDILWDSNPKSTFETNSGVISFIEYYKKRHGLEITNASQPLLLHMVKKKTSVAGKLEEFRVCLVPEFCNITGVKQDLMTHKFKKDIAEYTRLTPSKRFETLNQYIRNVRNSPEAIQILKDWGFSLADAVIDLNARVIQDTKIAFRNLKHDVARVSDWGREIGRDGLINPIDMINWIILYPERNLRETQRYVTKVRDLAKGFGCRIDQPLFISIPGKGYDSDYRKALEANINDHVQFVAVVMPMARESLYNELKRLLLCRRGIGSQMALVRTLQNDKIISAVALKLGLQMQAKLGGSLWAVVFPSICHDFMFCGIDTYHAKGRKSVGALVCSINENHTRYYTGVAFQEHEIADALKLHLIDACEARKRMVGRYPSLIVIVRDGVSDGGMQQVKDYELSQYLSVREALGIDFTLCFIVLQKRINTRFSCRGENPPAGTVVDHTITRRHYDDFFLVPQHTRIGTVSPTHYVVLYNDTKELNLDRTQKLCYKLCHIYYNWTGAVSVPAPCQYAHKAAYLVGQNLERAPMQTLNDKLYYL